MESPKTVHPRPSLTCADVAKVSYTVIQMSDKSVMVSVRMPVDVLQAVDERAAQFGWSRGRAIVEALRDRAKVATIPAALGIEREPVAMVVSASDESALSVTTATAQAEAPARLCYRCGGSLTAWGTSSRCVKCGINQ
jgi:hypothetical protein